MGCFIACFSASKNHPKSLKPPNQVPSSSGSTQIRETQEVLQFKQPIEQENIEIDISSTITKSNDKQEELQSININKKETYDLKIQSQEEFSTQEITNSFDDDEDLQEESSESLFSLSIGSRKHGSESEMGEKEVNSPITIQIVHSVLNPLDNLISPQKAIKAKTISPLKHLEKENIYLERELNIPFSEEEPLIIHSSKKLIREAEKKKKPNGEEVAVETSLSSWLVVGSETPPTSAKNSPNSICSSFPYPSRKYFGDRPILGELNLEELK